MLVSSYNPTYRCWNVRKRRDVPYVFDTLSGECEATQDLARLTALHKQQHRQDNFGIFEKDVPADTISANVEIKIDRDIEPMVLSETILPLQGWAFVTCITRYLKRRGEVRCYVTTIIIVGYGVRNGR